MYELAARRLPPLCVAKILRLYIILRSIISVHKYLLQYDVGIKLTRPLCKRGGRL